jgi:hypothetical protein
MTVQLHSIVGKGLMASRFARLLLSQFWESAAMLVRHGRVSALLLLFVATVATAQEYRLPFEGLWFVMQGGDTPNVNHHMAETAQWFGVDFSKVGGPSQRELVRSTGTTNEDFYSWGATVLSPVGGEIVAAVDDFPDNPLGIKNARNPAGNYLAIRVASNQYVFLAHLQRKSIVVKLGQLVTRGQSLAKCGNSGNTDFPHIHMHVQDVATFGEGVGQNVIFSKINVELSGKQFRAVDWPLIQGLFVWND